MLRSQSDLILAGFSQQLPSLQNHSESDQGLAVARFTVVLTPSGRLQVNR